MCDLLIIIDMQEGFRSNEALSIVTNVNKLVSNFNGKIVLSLFIDKKGSPFEEKLHWPKFQDLVNQKILKEVDDSSLERFFHDGYTILNNELKTYILQQNFSRVFVAGIYTDVCVIKTAMDLFDEKIDVKVIANACASLHGEKNHLYALDSLRHIIGRENVIDTAGIFTNDLQSV